MATWNPADRRAAIEKGLDGKKLSDHEVRKLQEATRQAGRVSEASIKALAEYERRYGRR